MPPQIINKPSELFIAITDTLRAADLGLKVGGPQDFDTAVDAPWVLIAIERDTSGIRANDGRKAHALTISLQAVLARQPGRSALAACDLACVLMDLITDNRWGLPGAQCGLPMNIEAAPSTFASGEQPCDAWTVSFTQTLYLGRTLLDDPTGLPRFARTWEVSNIDDPDHYQALKG